MHFRYKAKQVKYTISTNNTKIWIFPSLFHHIQSCRNSCNPRVQVVAKLLYSSISRLRFYKNSQWQAFISHKSTLWHAALNNRNLKKNHEHKLWVKLEIWNTWKGLRSAWRTTSALMVFHAEFEPLIRWLFWIADCRLGTSSGHKLCLTKSATATIRNCHIGTSQIIYEQVTVGRRSMKKVRNQKYNSTHKPLQLESWERAIRLEAKPATAAPWTPCSHSKA